MSVLLTDQTEENNNDNEIKRWNFSCLSTGNCQTEWSWEVLSCAAYIASSNLHVLKFIFFWLPWLLLCVRHIVAALFLCSGSVPGIIAGLLWFFVLLSVQEALSFLFQICTDMSALICLQTICLAHSSNHGNQKNRNFSTCKLLLAI